MKKTITVISVLLFFLFGSVAWSRAWAAVSCGWTRDPDGLKFCVNGIPSTYVNVDNSGGAETIKSGMANFETQCIGAFCTDNVVKRAFNFLGFANSETKRIDAAGPTARDENDTYYTCILAVGGYSQEIRNAIGTIINQNKVGCVISKISELSPGNQAAGAATTIGVVEKPNSTHCSDLLSSIKFSVQGRFVSNDGQIRCSADHAVSAQVVSNNNEVAGSVYNFCKQVPIGKQRDACTSCLSNKDGSEVKDRIYTAVGCLHTSNQELVRDLIRLLMGVAGAVALLSILGGAFLFSVSQGDANKVKQARELLTAAVSGLVFMILSIVILNFVGVSILKIPGLSQ